VVRIGAVLPFMCAATAANRGKSVVGLLMQITAVKDSMSGGGVVNFTNRMAASQGIFIPTTRIFCISALRRFSSQRFLLMLVDRHDWDLWKDTRTMFCEAPRPRLLLDILLTELDNGLVQQT